jgi:hypothetical protein
MKDADLSVRIRLSRIVPRTQPERRVVVVVVVLVVVVALAVADGDHSGHGHGHAHVYDHDLLRLSRDYGCHLRELDGHLPLPVLPRLWATTPSSVGRGRKAV